jgi:hypothetical protein
MTERLRAPLGLEESTLTRRDQIRGTTQPRVKAHKLVSRCRHDEVRLIGPRHEQPPVLLHQRIVRKEVQAHSVVESKLQSTRRTDAHLAHHEAPLPILEQFFDRLVQPGAISIPVETFRYFLALGVVRWIIYVTTTDHYAIIAGDSPSALYVEREGSNGDTNVPRSQITR